MNDIGENWYCRPEGNNLLLSPEDEIPSAPCDVWAEDIDVAALIERITDVLDLEPVKVESSWAGLRAFAPDRVLSLDLKLLRKGFSGWQGRVAKEYRQHPPVRQWLHRCFSKKTCPVTLKIMAWKQGHFHH